MRTHTLVLVLLLQLWALVTISEGISCRNPSAYAGQALCDQYGGYCGECVSFVKRCTGDKRATSSWEQGAPVRDTEVPYGTGIATFVDGRYHGHAAIYTGQNQNGIQVWDQWKGHPVSERTIRWNGKGISNNGNNFYVIE